MQRWQKILAQGFTTVEALCQYLEIPIPLDSAMAQRSFATLVPKGFAARMEKGNTKDPLLLQVLPQKAELITPEGFVNDPLDEGPKNVIPGLIHKYHGRVLLTFTGACAVNCRYCFRRHFPYQENNLGRLGWSKVFDYLQQHTEVTELILSGGDPLLASDATWKSFLDELIQVPHIDTLRIHSRIPVVLPERINESWLDLMKTLPLKKVLVIHANHANELNDQVRDALQGFSHLGGVLLNQSVLLHQVNDCAATLVALSRKLFECGVLPYYLHTLDKVSGSAHYEISRAKISKIYSQMHASLPGYLLPKLVMEEAGKPGKTLLNADSLLH